MAARSPMYVVHRVEQRLRRRTDALFHPHESHETRHLDHSLLVAGGCFLARTSNGRQALRHRPSKSFRTCRHCALARRPARASPYDDVVWPTTSYSGSVLVARDGVALLQGSSGQADAAAGKGCSAETRFQIASVSKQFTAASVMLLVDDGALALDDNIGRFLHGCAPQWRDLTLHQLLSHTAGLEHWNDVPDFDVTRPGEPDEFLELFATVPLRSAPSGAWHYSSPGICSPRGRSRRSAVRRTPRS